MRRFKKTHNSTLCSKTVNPKYESLGLNYGLKNKKELSKFLIELSNIKRLFRTETQNSKKLEQFKQKLVRIGLLKEGASNYLDITLEKILERRLQTIVSKKFNLSLLDARQKITHGHIRINGIIKRFPCYIIRLENQDLITLD